MNKFLLINPRRLKFFMDLKWHSFEEEIKVSSEKRQLYINPYFALAASSNLIFIKISCGALSYLSKFSRKNVVLNIERKENEKIKVSINDNSILLWNNFYLNYLYSVQIKNNIEFNERKIQVGYSDKKCNLNLRFEKLLNSSWKSWKPDNIFLSTGYKFYKNQIMAAEFSYNSLSALGLFSISSLNKLNQSFKIRLKVDTDGMIFAKAIVSLNKNITSEICSSTKLYYNKEKEFPTLSFLLDFKL